MKGKIGKEEENAKLFSQLVASQEALKDAVRAAKCLASLWPLRERAVHMNCCCL